MTIKIKTVITFTTHNIKRPESEARTPSNRQSGTPDLYLTPK